MKTAQEMYQYCLSNHLGKGISDKWALKHFALIEKNIGTDEDALMCFIGLINFVSVLDHGGYYAFAVTNKRIIMAQKRLVGEISKSVFLDTINDITYVGGLAYGVITIDSIKEKFNIALDKKQAGNINTYLQDLLHQLKQSESPASIQQSRPVSSSSDPIEEIKKFKELLDTGIITSEEFETKKKDLLGL